MPIRYRVIPGGRRVVDTESAPASPTSTGTVDEILGDVGDDSERASAALSAELARDKPRSTLVSKLEAIRDA